MHKLGELHSMINSIVSIHGVTFGDYDDPKTWIVQYKNPPTADQLAEVEKIKADFDLLKGELRSTSHVVP